MAGGGDPNATQRKQNATQRKRRSRSSRSGSARRNRESRARRRAEESKDDAPAEDPPEPEEAPTTPTMHVDPVPDPVPQLSDQIDVKGSITRAAEYINRTSIGNNGIHAALVCVVCDRFIIGMEKFHWLGKDVILEHQDRLSVRSYEAFHGVQLPEELKEQYAVQGLEGLLLSPRARKQLDEFMCCSQCHRAMQKSRRGKAPPKFAIANGFAIGSIPPEVIAEEDMSDLISAMISPVRPFSYVFSYLGGAHKSVRGHHQFFSNPVSHSGGVIQSYLETGANPNVFCVLCGRFTPEQRVIAKQKAQLDTRVFLKLLTWFVESSNHPAYKDVQIPAECPRPTYVQESPNANNTDEPGDPDVERAFEGGRWFFPSSGDPSGDTGTFNSQEEFARAMLDNTVPTLLFLGGEFARDYEVPLENIFPTVFPFGQGGTKVPRRNRVSEIEVLRHYTSLSLSQFHRPNFILVITGMYHRSKAFGSGFIKCKARRGDSTFAEKVSELSSTDITNAVARRDADLPTAGTASEFLTAVTTSCKPVGHSNEAAAYARRQFFAMMDHFGSCSLFVTITPDDECSFRVRLYASSGQEVSRMNRGGARGRGGGRRRHYFRLDSLTRHSTFLQLAPLFFSAAASSPVFYVDRL